MQQTAPPGPPPRPDRLTFDTVERALQAPLPGHAAQERMATRPRLVLAAGAGGPPLVEAAVLIALFERDEGLWLPLTLRSDGVAHHRGQISFPGGAREPHDADLWTTALREACEELGLPPEDSQRLGALTPLLIPASRFVVHPFVARLARPPVYRPDSAEVAAVIELPLSVLTDPASKQEEQRELHGQATRVPLYRYGEHAIWGATAMMLSELEVLLAEVE